jgi:signal transduction histidine kinase
MVQQMTSDESPKVDVSIVLNTLADVAPAVMRASEAQTVEQLLEELARLAKQLIPSRYAALGVPDANMGMRYFKTSGMTPEELAMMEHMPEGHGLLGAVLKERRTIRVAHIQSDPRSSGFPHYHPSMTSFLGTPILAGEQVLGMLYLCDKDGSGEFAESDEWMLESLAGYAALAIAGSMLRDKTKRLTLLEERQRIIMELHDGVIQSLYAVGMYLDLLRTGAESVAPDSLSAAINDLNLVIDDVREYIMGLRNMDNADGSKTILACMQEMVERLKVEKAMDVEVDAPNSVPLVDDDTFDSACQIVHEALSNAARHSRAKGLKLSVLQTESALIVSIKDDGIGFDTAQRSEGLGLRNMRRRAELIHGHVQIDSQPGQGTRLTLTVPTNLRE